MKSFILNMLDEIRTSYWFVPAIMAVSAVLLSFAMIELDTKIQPDGPEWASWLFDNQPEGARQVLATIAGSMITVAGVVFSITLVTVSNAAFQFGPRLLTTFMRDRVNQITLGTFIATFLYCLMVLRSVQSPAEASASGEVSDFVPHLALLGAIGLSLCSIAVLIQFFHHIPQSIHVSHILATIGEEFTNRLDARFPLVLGKGETQAEADLGKVESFKKQFSDKEACIHIEAPKSGYVRFIDTHALMSHAVSEDLSIWLKVEPGSFVTKGQDLMLTLCGCEETPEEVHDHLRSSIIISEMRSPMQDIEFLAQELSEIGMRALSPGINDPVTAIAAMDWIGAGLTLLGQREGASPLRRDEDGTPRIVTLSNDFSELSELSLGAMIPFAARNMTAAKGYLTVTNRMLKQLSGTRAASLRDQRQYFLDIAGEALTAAEVKYLNDML